MTFTRIGIIDIGSNSIRLVVYERTRQGAHRVISEHKESARLSERISTDGTIHTEDILSIVPILSHFTLLCKKNKVISVRAVATAAIRNASNSKEIVNVLQQETGLTIEVLSGYEEARFGFLGVINSLDIQDGIIVDIGGGSTEVTLFRNRKLEHTVSLPFGSVNTAKQFMNDGFIDLSDQSPLRIMVEHALADHPWISMNPGLPLIGLGGTIRTLGKMSQKHIKYSLPLTHNYVMKNGELEYYLGLLPTLPLEKRKKIEGLSKERADIIIPGLAILQTIHTTSKASPIIVSGSGLRDGLFQETVHPDQPEIQNVLESSIQNLILLHHPEDAEIHIHQVNKLAMMLFDQIAPNHFLSEKERRYLHAAALLYRIGVSVNYYQYSKHTQYILTQARIDSFSHREILLCALIASYKAKSRSHQMVLKHKDILEETDESLIIQLGTLLHIAIALDKSETQPIEQLNVQLTGKELHLQLHCRSNPFTELRELNSLQKDFQKAWGYKLTYEIAAFSTK
jgi:exopolyphosphatase/guanosine-5'-triphosphate,3'-diphosphate pyrophosphatase